MRVWLGLPPGDMGPDAGKPIPEMLPAGDGAAEPSPPVAAN
jgi:hypothetical protein